jgi:hypothetical protein
MFDDFLRRPFARDRVIDPNRILHRDFSPDGPVVGYIDGHPIRASIVDAEGRRYSYAGIAPRRRDGSYDVTALRKGEWVVPHGLVYS